MVDSKFTAARANAFLECIKFGGSIRTAAAEAGVGHQTALRWIEKGKKAPEDSQFGKFFGSYLAATASLPMRALRAVWDGVPDDPKLAFRVLERREKEWAPPAPQLPAHVGGPVVINLSLTGSAAPVPTWIEAEVADAEEAPALGDGGDAAPSIGT